MQYTKSRLCAKFEINMDSRPGVDYTNVNLCDYDYDYDYRSVIMITITITFIAIQ